MCNRASDVNSSDAERPARPNRRGYMTQDKRLLPDRKVCERYDVVPRTIQRWDQQPELGFPPPIRINKRKYRYLSELIEFDQRQAARRGR